MTDRYTKAVLTIIAVALAAIAAENGVKIARAAKEACGSSQSDACYVRTEYSTGSPLSVKIHH
jgi:hypothetical protein